MKAEIKNKKNFYKDYIEEVFNQRNFDRIDHYVSENDVLHDVPPLFPKGKILL